MQDRKHVVFPDDLLTNPAGHSVESVAYSSLLCRVSDRNGWKCCNGFYTISPSDLYQYQMTKDSPCRCSSYCSPSCSWKARMTWDQTASADAWSTQPHLRLCRCQLNRKPFVTKPLTLFVLSSLLSITTWFRMKQIFSKLVFNYRPPRFLKKCYS